MNRLLMSKTAFILGFLAAMFSASLWAAPPTVVLTVKSIGELVNDADAVAAAVGQEDFRETVTAAVDNVTGGGWGGLDTEKLFGVYWDMAAPAGDPIGKTVAFLPVADVDAFKALVKKLVPDFDENDGVWTMTAIGTPLNAKVKNGYCFVSTSADSIANPADPAKLSTSRHDISIELNIGSIPKELKASFLKEAEENGRKGLQPAASEEEAVGQKIGFEGTLAALTAVTNDGDKISFGLTIDAEKELVSMDLGVTSKPNTPMAKAMTVFSKTTPVFAAVASESVPLQIIVSQPTTWMAGRWKEVFEAIRKKANEGIENDDKLDTDAEKKAARGVAKRFFDIAEATCNSGTLDLVITLDEGDDETARLVAGLKLAKGDDAAKLLDDIVKLAKESPEYTKVKLDVAKHGGARIHEITPDLNEKHNEVFGDGPVHLAIRADSMWISMGGGNLDALKSTLEASGKKVSKAGAPISIRMKPASVVTLVEDDDKELIERAESIAGESGDRLNFEIAPAAGNGAKFHIDFGLDLLKLGKQ